MFLFIYLYIYFVCLCDFWGNSHEHDPREGLWMLIVTRKLCLQNIWIFVKFWKSSKTYYKTRDLFAIVL